MRAPGVAIARTDREAKAAIVVRGGVEIAYRVNDMVDAARHGWLTADSRFRPSMMPQSRGQNKNGRGLRDL